MARSGPLALPMTRPKVTEHVAAYLSEVKQIVDRLDRNQIERMVELLASLRDRQGRLFAVGLGGGAGNASHAVSDFRKLANIEAYTPLDNASELTARFNDEGWEWALVDWLRGSRLNENDLLLVFSVSGGSPEHGISMNVVRALEHARQVGSAVAGIVGYKGGATAEIADVCVTVPLASPARVTPHTEAFQAVLWHLLVSHPRLQVTHTKWESAYGVT